MTDALEYIPHTGKMALIKSIIESSEDSIECLVDSAASTLFVDNEGRYPSWLGIEYMAQTVAAYAGWSAKSKGEPPKLGMLLGTRSFNCNEPYLSGLLKVKAEVLFQSDELASFDCTIKCKKDNRVLVKAKINVFQPEDFLKAIQE
jgi:predicted hotdog family 3-hydroxylacyl-ACP dehydratase